MTAIAPATSDIFSNEEEHVVRIAKALGVGAKNRFFREVYYGKKALKTTDELSSRVGVSKKKILDLGKFLHRARAVEERRIGGRIQGYAKLSDVIALRDRILRLAGNPDARERVPTKRTPAIGKTSITVRVARERSYKATQITIEDVDSFSKVAEIDATQVPTRMKPERLPELQFKHGIRFITGEQTKAQDWGGEDNDFETTHFRFRGRRVSAAFAFKGPATTGQLTPAKMGTLGDQVARLAASASRPSLLFVGYEGEISGSLVRELRICASQAAREQGRNIHYCTIAKVDAYKLRLAYPKAFAKAKRLYGKKASFRSRTVRNKRVSERRR